MDANIEFLAFTAVNNLKAAGKTVATAESCTGGLIAAALTGVPGASAAFRYGWVTYCNEAKENQLGISPALIAEHTVVSEPVVAAMAEGAMQRAKAQLAVAVSGNAGPTAAEGEPPVGTVCIALAVAGQPTHTETIFRPGLDRTRFRNMVAARALELIAAHAARRAQS